MILLMEFFMDPSEHQVTSSITSTIELADDPETGESYSGSETLPKAIVIIFYYKDINKQ